MKQVIIEISARHLHLSQSDLDKLFGSGFKLKKLKDLSQPGEFASTSTVDLIGQEGILKKVRIVGPVRKKTQVELAVTDCRTIGVKPVFRLSGDHQGSVGVIIKGPKSKIKISSGVIVAIRHLHISSQQAQAWGLKNKQNIQAIVKGSRGLIFSDILVRIGDYNTRLHIDTDEANAAGLLCCSKVFLYI